MKLLNSDTRGIYFGDLTLVRYLKSLLALLASRAELVAFFPQLSLSQARPWFYTISAQQEVTGGPVILTFVVYIIHETGEV